MGFERPGFCAFSSKDGVVMSRFQTLSMGGLVGLLGWAVLVPSAMASPSGMVDHLCYMELPNGSVVNLDHLCNGGSRRRASPTDTGVISLRRGTDQLLTEMQQLQAALRSARTAEERAAIRQQFEDRMPYSNRVRQLQEQAQSLQQQLQQTSSESARRTLARRIDGINQQIRQDSSYQTVSRARNEVFQQMNR